MRHRTTTSLVLRLLAPLIFIALLLAAPAYAVKRGAEVVDSGGGVAAGGTFRLCDAIGQVCDEPMTTGTGIRGYDGFLLCLPSINVPVEGTFYASLTGENKATIRWALDVLDGIEALRVYRATEEDGPYTCVHRQPIEPTATGFYEDDTLWPETTFWYELRAMLQDGTEDVVGVSRASVSTSGVLAFALRPPAPNPCRENVGLSFDIPRTAGTVTLNIYNVRGQLVKEVVDRPLECGRYDLSWDTKDEGGRRVSTGVYFLRLSTLFDTASTKVIVLR